MYYTNWDKFVGACATLCDQAVTQPRYCLRWRHEQSLLVIKVTDDTQCIKFKTRSTVFLNRFDAFNRALMARFQNRNRLNSSKSPLTGPTTADVSATTIASGSSQQVAEGEQAKEGLEEAKGKGKKKKSKKKSKN